MLMQYAAQSAADTAASRSRRSSSASRALGTETFGSSPRGVCRDARSVPARAPRRPTSIAIFVIPLSTSATRSAQSLIVRIISSSRRSDRASS